MSTRSLPRLLSVILVAAVLGGLPAANAGPASFTVTVAKGGKGTGTVTSSPAGIDCGVTCSASLPSGSVTLSAASDPSSTFMGWTGPCTGKGDCQFTLSADTTVHAKFMPSYRPDAWIKLCGLSTGCTVGPPPPHPWHGNQVYNTTGAKQTVAVRMEDGEGVRWWLRLENDGATTDTITVKGCSGTPRFVINAVLVGWATRPDWHLENITKAFKAGTATFKLPPASTGAYKKLTVNIVAPTTVEGITYACPITIISKGDPSLKDTVIGKVTTT